MKIVLASQSPRRRELLKRILPDFTVHPANIPEILPKEINPAKAAEFLACQKACAAAQETGADYTIGCDTAVVLDKKILGKPANKTDAFFMLKELSGKKHTVYTGVCIVTPEDSVIFTESADVWFSELSDKEIRRYIDSGEPMDKAGAYGIQGLGSCFVRRIEGDFFSVVGLPVCRLYEELKKLKLF